MEICKKIKEPLLCVCGHKLDYRNDKLCHKKRSPPIYGGKNCMDCKCSNPEIKGIQNTI